jgi:transcriptional regulator with XRE-family HTH domain
VCIDVNAALGRRLAARRRSLGWTLKQVGETVGVSAQMVHKWEIGQSAMDAAKLYRLAVSLGVEPSYFFEGIDPRDGIGSETSGQ